jgi:hypothetical protein
MISLKKGLASLAVGLALTALASPSYAQEGHFQISRERAQALHECSRLLERYPEYLWGNTEDISMEPAWPNMASRNKPDLIACTKRRLQSPPATESAMTTALGSSIAREI